MNPLIHYVLLGESGGLATSPHFVPAWYRQRHAVPGSACALAHCLQHRRSQRVSPLPSLDVARYVQDAATLLPQRDPYAHFLANGPTGGESQQAAA